MIGIPAVAIACVSQRGPQTAGGGKGMVKGAGCAAAVLRAALASEQRTEDRGATHARYATARLGSWLKCSDSIKRSSRFQLIWDGSLGHCTGGGRRHAVKCSKGSHVERWGADRVQRAEMTSAACERSLTMRPAFRPRPCFITLPRTILMLPTALSLSDSLANTPPSAPAL